MSGGYSDDDSYGDYGTNSESNTREYSDNESYGNRGYTYNSKSITRGYSDDESSDDYVDSKTRSGEYSDDDSSYALGDHGTSRSGGNQVSVRQQTYRLKNEDKQSGSYARFTAKDKTVSGEPFVDRYGNRGYKNEYTKSSTYKAGDKRGYTEYSREDKVKHVQYSKRSRSYSNNNNNKAVKSYSKYSKY